MQYVMVLVLAAVVFILAIGGVGPAWLMVVLLFFIAIDVAGLSLRMDSIERRLPKAPEENA